MVGIIDVITHVELHDPVFKTNRLVQAILAALPEQPPDRFEVIIDYKGMRRPPLHTPSQAGPGFWDIYGWQVQTYAHLRSMHEDSLPVVAGIILYLNELLPTRSDLMTLRREIQAGKTDIVPTARSETERLLRTWRAKGDVPTLPLDFRLRRALRVLGVTKQTMQTALREFDAVVARIEVCRGKELLHGRVLSTWEKNPADEDTCTACDARTFCPSYTKESHPRLPGLRPV
jgi:hypothetical protein